MLGHCAVWRHNKCINQYEIQQFEEDFIMIFCLILANGEMTSARVKRYGDHLRSYNQSVSDRQNSADFKEAISEISYNT